MLFFFFDARLAVVFTGVGSLFFVAFSGVETVLRSGCLTVVVFFFFVSFRSTVEFLLDVVAMVSCVADVAVTTAGVLIAFICVDFVADSWSDATMFDEDVSCDVRFFV